MTSILKGAAAAAAAKSLQSCPTLCDPIDGSSLGSPFPGILQARTLEWVAISFSSAWKWKVKVKSLSRVRLSATPWTAAYQAPPSMGFSRQKYWSEVPLPSPHSLNGELKLNANSNYSNCSNRYLHLKESRQMESIDPHIYKWVSTCWIESFLRITRSLINIDIMILQFKFREKLYQHFSKNFF